jgi:tRNA (guanosine-2'-O-)-methyltransferase
MRGVSRETQGLAEGDRRRCGGLHIVLDDLQNPGNVSAIIRSCEGLGVAVVHVVGDGPGPATVNRASKGAERWMALEFHANASECIATLRERGLRVLCACPPPAGVAIWDCDLRAEVAVVLGNELYGASAAARVLADAIVHIPMLGVTESLNVAAAAAISVYEAMRQRRAAPQGQ